MVKYVVITIAIVAMVFVLLVVASGAVQADGQEERVGKPAGPDPVRAAPGDGGALAVLALVAGAAVLAGGVWAKTLLSMPA
jgi:hypothetical protein